MSVDRESIISQYRLHENDTGSVEVQVAILTARINHLTDHLKIHKKDFSSRRGLLKLVGRRRKLLKYLRKSSPESYKNLIKSLNLRR
ncbi:MAG: 30S ribosomal protein S15 [Thermotoga sp.]|nr:30S ribosomal protein S15 [Thermotogota bacterium]RKX52502.1 MAG: 30S ribosomal protein S15 [Thermotoga sp.]